MLSLVVTLCSKCRMEPSIVVLLQSDKSCLAVVSSAQNEVPGMLSSFLSVGTSPQ